MTTAPLVSVIIPAYNYAHLLPRAIGSVLSQSYDNFEVIIVDDGSTDDTGLIVAQFQARDARLKYVRQQNGGPNAARNRGLDLAQGDYVAFLDADDEWLPDKLAKQVSYALENPRYGIIGCGFRWINDEGVTIIEVPGAPPPGKQELIRHLKLRYFNVGSASGVLIRKECFAHVGNFDEALRGSEDRDMWLRIAQRYDIMNLPDVLVLIHIHDSNSHKDASKMLASRLKFIEKHFVEESMIFKRQAVSYAYLDASREASASDATAAAFYYAMVAILNMPFKVIQDDDKYKILVKCLIPPILLRKIRSILRGGTGSAS